MILKENYNQSNAIEIDPKMNTVHLEYSSCDGDRATYINRLCEWTDLTPGQQAELLKINDQAQTLLDRAALVLAGSVL